MENIFFDIGLIFIVASIFAYIAKAIRQPKIPFYVLAGFVVGPLGLMIAEKIGLIDVFLSRFGIDLNTFFISDPGIIKIFGEIGIAFLLFVVGLELNIDKLKDIVNAHCPVLDLFSNKTPVDVSVSRKSSTERLNVA